MEEWCKRGLSDRPYIATKEEYDKLPDIAKAEIIQQHPAHVEYLTADPSKLSADLRLRMAKRELSFEDRDQLQDAGFHAAVKFLDQRRKEYMQQMLEQSIEQQRQDMAAMAEAREKELAQMRADNDARFQAQQRAEYIRFLHRTKVQDVPVNIESAVG